MSRHPRLLAVGLGLAAVAVLLVVVILDPWAGLPTRSVPLPTPLPSDAGIPGGEIVLRADGVGELSFGQTAAEVLSAMHSLIGDPGEDTEQPCGDDGSQIVRWLGWGNLSLLVEDDRFVGYVAGIYFPPIGPELNLRTEDGLRLRMSEEELIETYGERVEIRPQQSSDEGEVLVFGVDGYSPTDGGAPTGIGGYVERRDGAGQVIALNGGLLHC